MSNLPTTSIAGQAVTMFNEKQLATLKATIAKDATNEEFQMFVEVCNHAQLNPFTNQIYFIKMGGKPTIQISAEGVQAIARRREDFDGIVAAVVKENDEFEADIAEGTVVHKVKSMVRGQTVGSYCIAKRKGFPNVLVLITSDQVENYKTGFNKAMWTNNFEDMIQKHAIKRACKLQFGIELELDDEGSPQQGALDKVGSYSERQRVDMGDITPQPQVIVTGADSSVDKTEEMERQWAKIKGQTDLLGWKKSDVTNFIKEKVPGKKVDELTLQDLVGLSKLLEFETKKLEEQQPTGDLTKDADSIYDAI
ncbi:RecT family recombinase [Ammoniphilus sp. YIM 78166]|uniref:RecT family recombinase n=1 Tax=Ammoniphilus sp. YIM 78166 TaxID=1644106 RepID=UPI0010706123|nr:RecT family recombinase [Ammoniphilus sp. YIM 78166]